MDDFVEQYVDSFCELAKVPTSSLNKLPTPFLDETTDPKKMEILFGQDIGGDATHEGHSENRNRALDQLGEEVKAAKTDA